MSIAVQLEPRNALAYNERGLALVRKGNYPQAILSYSRALSILPTLHIARFNRALAQRLHGQYDLSIAEFTTLLEQHPKAVALLIQREGNQIFQFRSPDSARCARHGHRRRQAGWSFPAPARYRPQCR